MLLKDRTETKHLYLRRLTAQLREKDIELAKLLEHKMKVMKEMVEVVNKNPKNIEDLGGDPIDIADVATGSNINKQGEFNKDGSSPSQTCQTEGISLPNPEYLTLVKEHKDKNDYTKEQLLNAVQVSNYYIDSKDQSFIIYIMYNRTAS